MPGPLLIGLLAAGIDQYNKYSDQRTNRMQGREFDRAFGGMDPNLMSPMERAQALAGRGLLSGAEFMNTGDNMYNQAEAMRRQRVSSGPGYMNADLNERKWGADPANPAGPNYIAPRPGYGQGYDPQLDPAFLLEQATNPPFDPTNPQPKSFTEFLAANQQRLAQDASLRDRFASFNNDMIPLNQFDVAVDNALGLVSMEGIDGPNAMSTDEQVNARNVVNDVIQQAKSNYWRFTLGRTDAPGEAEIKELNALFPPVTASAFRDNRKQVEHRLRVAQERNIAAMKAKEFEFMTQTGLPTVPTVPDTSGGSGLPPGFTKDD